MKRVPHLLPVIFLLIFVFSVYWFTKPPSILWIDSGTMIAASSVLGIPNPPGFPFYMMATHAFAKLLPLGSYLLELELFTILFSLWLLFLIYQIILLVVDNCFPQLIKSNVNGQMSMVRYLSAFFGTITLAFSYQYWSQSQNTEAFIFSYSFVALFAFLLLKIEVSRSFMAIDHYKSFLFKILLTIAFLYGLAAGTNPTVTVMIPAVLYVMYRNRQSLTPAKIVILGLIFALTVSAVYAYLPIRAMSWPFVNWGNPQTPELFIDHLHGAGLNINEPGPTGSVNGFTGSPFVFAKSVSYYFLSSFFQFTPILWPLIPLGAWQLFKKNRQVFLILALAPIFNAIYGGIYLSGNQESWFIISWIFFAIFAAIGFFHLAQNLSIVKGQLSTVKLLTFFSLCLLPLLVFFIPLNRSNHYYSADYIENLYSPLEKDAILIGTGDFFDALSHYVHVADVWRKDVIPITANVFYVNKWNRDTLRNTTDLSISEKLESMIRYETFTEYNEVMNQLITENIDKRPIYVTHLTLRASALAGTTAGQLRLDSRYKFAPHGLALKVVKAQETSSPNPAAYDYKLRSPLTKKPFYLEKNYQGAFNNILNDYIYGYEYLGDWYGENQQDDKALKYYKIAKDISEKNAEILAHIGEFYHTRGDFNAAYQYLEKAQRFDVNNVGIHYLLGVTYTKLGRNKEALQQLESVKLLTKPDDEIYQQAEKLIAEIRVFNLDDPAFREQTASWQTIKDEKNNFTIKIPDKFFKEDLEGGSIFITDRNPGNLGLNVQIVGQELEEGQNLDEFLAKPPFYLPGTIIDLQKINLSSFRAAVEIYGTEKGDSTQRFMLLKNDWIWQFKVYPGNSVKLNQFYKMLSTFEPLKR